MKLAKALVITILILQGWFLFAEKIIYVSQKSVTQTGTSWNSAYHNLETAVEEAWKNLPEKTEIRVGEGDYAINSCLELPQGMSLYGGLKTNASSNGSKEDILVKSVILQRKKNVPVMKLHNVSGITIDGFTISGAQHSCGLSIRDCDSTVIISNCLIIDNVSKDSGAGVRIIDSSPTFFNCKIASNKITGKGCGAGMYISGQSGGNYLFCIVNSNDTNGDEGGGIYAECTPNLKTVFSNCDILQNFSQRRASGLYASGNILMDSGSICTNIVKSDKSGKGVVIEGEKSTFTMTDGALISNNFYDLNDLKEVIGIDGYQHCKVYEVSVVMNRSYSVKSNTEDVLRHDLKTIQQDLFLPEMEDSKPGPGKRVRIQFDKYSGTGIYHCLFLPSDWKPGVKYPVIVDFPGNGPFQNRFGDHSRGLPESNPMGYGISGGKGAICLGLGYIDGDKGKIAEYWWGNVQESIQYCLDAVHQVCSEYGGDKDNVILTGFSRSAIGAGFICRHNDEIASLWKGYIMYDGFDTDLLQINNRYGYSDISYNYDTTDCSGNGYEQRFERIKGKPYLQIGGLSNEVPTPMELAKKYDYHIELMDKTHRNHNASWALRPTPERKKAREWYKIILNTPATHQ